MSRASNQVVAHRDLKPLTILVAWTDGEVVPKVIDFRVAKAKAHLNLGPMARTTEQREEPVRLMEAASGPDYEGTLQAIEGLDCAGKLAYPR